VNYKILDSLESQGVDWLGVWTGLRCGLARGPMLVEGVSW